ncbi:DUF6445 family protein [Massilia sp. TS11]|uniref:DUF6445 family protein n=1 Tax=Massilia sp. TS11 TaxID=2908003 RepID=UPI001EDA0062|nr:DUF6445 family protein [Massilia sp. TS11]
MQLSYRKPQPGRDYWVQDDFLPDAQAVSARCYARSEWEYGFPHSDLPWPGMRAPQALTPAELEHVEAWVRRQTGARRLWQVQPPDGRALNHNHVQLVGMAESGPRPHTDSLKLCKYAAVLYLSPDPDPDTGTSFYRLRYPDGRLGGNIVLPPHANLREALKVKGLPLEAWHEEVRIANRFNRILLYKANLVHSATNYFGFAQHERRMTAVFFWMA